MIESKLIPTVSVATYSSKENLSDFKNTLYDTLTSKFSDSNVAVLPLTKNYASFALLNLEDERGNPVRVKFMVDYNFKRFVKNSVIPTHIIFSSAQLEQAALKSRNSEKYVDYDYLADGYIHEHLPHIKMGFDLDMLDNTDRSKTVDLGVIVEDILKVEGFSFKK